MKVDFLILGAQKCGTTTLFNLLSKHPKINPCKEKEPAFWSHTRNWREAITGYHELFDKEFAECNLNFEASTAYTFFPIRNLGIWNDIYEYNPNMKFIYIVRNPIDRIVSSWMHTYEMEWEDEPLNKAVINNRLYIDITRYATQIKPYIEKFGRQNVLIIDFDDLIQNQDTVVKEICDFLKIDRNELSQEKKLKANRSVEDKKVRGKFIKYTSFAKRFQENVPKGLQKIARPLWQLVAYNSKRRFIEKPVMDMKTKRMVLQMLDLEIKELELIMGENLGKWLNVNEQYEC